MTLTLAQLLPLFTNAGLAVAGAAAIAVPVAIHLLTRLRRRQQKWAAMRFILEAYRRQKQRLQLEQWLLLLVRCLVVLVLGLALSGPLLAAWRSLGGAGPGRTICILLDDSLSTQAQQDGKTTRFDLLRQQALRFVDNLRGSDRVAVYRVARPAGALLAPPTLDRAQARQLIEGLQPRSSAADWPAALASVSSMLEQQRVPFDRAMAVVLSDFAAGTVDLDRPAPAEFAALSKHASILVSRPMTEVANMQIAALTPRRQMIVAQPGRPATVPLELRLRRFAADQPDALVGVDLSLYGDAADKPLATQRAEHRWSAGQSLALLNVEIPLPAETAPAATGGAGFTIAARLDAASGGDAIASDDQRFAVVEVRRRLAVALIDEAGTLAADQPWFLRPRDWLRLALAPEVKAEGGATTRPSQPSGAIELIDVSAPALDEQALGSIDAAIVLRPDLLSPRGWRALKTVAERGGLVWIFLPPSETPSTWSTALKEQLGLDWKLGLAPRTAASAAAAGVPPGAAAGEADAAWSLAAESPVPEPLALLSGDWEAMLRPIRVSKRVDLAVTGGQDAVWLRVADGDAASPNVLLASAGLGDGRVLLLVTALDTNWTNLPTKPLFVPLLHETLRGVLGSAGDSVRLSKLTAGDQPLLGRRWEGTQELRTPAAVGAAPVSGGSIVLRRTDQGLTPAAPLERPGVYTAKPGGAGSGGALRLAVNVAADAGNTQAIDPQALARWLQGVGEWSWLDAVHPELALNAETPRRDIGLLLLWATLALLLIETGLARWFSHAKGGAN